LEQIELKRGDCSWRLPAVILSVHMQPKLKKVHTLREIKVSSRTNLGTCPPRCTFACHLLKSSITKSVDLCHFIRVFLT